MNETLKPFFEIPAGRIEMSRNQDSIDSYLAGLDTITGLVNNSLEAFRALGYDELTMPEIMDLVWNNKNVESLVRDRATDGKPVKIGGLFFSADKVREMVEIPNLSAFEASIAALKKSAKELKEKNQIRLQHFELLEGKAEISETEKQAGIDRWCQFAETDAEKEVTLILEDIRAKLQYLQDKYKFHALSFKPKDLFEQGTGDFGWEVKTNIHYHLIKQFFTPSHR